MRPKLITFLLVLSAGAQAAVLVGRGGPDGNSNAPTRFLLGDTLARLDGVAVDGSEDVLAIPMQDGATTIVYAFSSECAHCDDVAPDWASHFAKQIGEGVRRVAITRDRPDVAASYAERFGWDVRILSMPELAATDRRSFFLSRTPWLHVFDRHGTLRFQGHGSALDRVEEIAARLSHSLHPRSTTTTEIGGS